MTAVASLTNVYVIVDQAAKITKVTDLALVIKSPALNQDFIFCQTFFNIYFCPLFFLSHKYLIKCLPAVVNCITVITLTDVLFGTA